MSSLEMAPVGGVFEVGADAGASRESRTGAVYLALVVLRPPVRFGTARRLAPRLASTLQKVSDHEYSKSPDGEYKRPKGYSVGGAFNSLKIARVRCSYIQRNGVHHY